MNPVRRALPVLILLGAMSLAVAGGLRASHPQQPPTPADRARAVERTLRCPTCQGLSIADSPSPIATGMRSIVTEQLASGRSPQQVRQYFVDRYSTWILLSPPRRGMGWAVWLLPLVLVGAGGACGLGWARRRTSAVAPGAEAMAAAARLAERPPTRGSPGGWPRTGGGDRAAEERVWAALELLDSVRDESPVDPEAEHLALRRLAVALESVAAPAVTGVAATGTPRAVPKSALRRHGTRPAARRRLAYPALVGGFAVVVALLLVRNVGVRGRDGLPTGLLVGPRSAEGTQSGGPLAALQAATVRTPANPSAWLALGRELDRQGRLAQAYAAYRRALDLGPGDVETRQLVGATLIRGGSSDEAVGVLAPLAKGRGVDPRSLLLLGLAQRGAGQPRAAATLRRYLQVAPRGPFADEVRRILRTAP